MAYQSALRGGSATILASAARTATPTVDTFNAPDADELLLIINVTAVTSSPSVVFTIQGVDIVSNATWNILASVAITGTGTTVLRVSPNLTAAANTIAKDIVPSYFTVSAAHGNSNSITYTVVAQAV